MAGPAAHRQLTQANVPPGLRIGVATPADDEAMRRLLRDNPLRGAISVSLEREPDYFHGVDIGGAKDETIVVYEGEQLLCMGKCSVRARMIGGRRRQVGYLGELRLDAAAQGRFEVVRRGYDFFRALHGRAPADFYFTSIAADNLRARRLLESGVRGLPAYTFLTEFVTLFVPVPRRASERRFTGESVTPPQVPEVTAFLNEQASRYQLAACWTEAEVRGLARHGLRDDDFRVMRDGGRIVACGALWDQRGFRQTVIRGYSPALARLRPFINWGARFLPTPALPEIGTVVKSVFLAPFGAPVEAGERLPEFVRSFFPSARARGADFIVVGFEENDPRLAVLRKGFRTRSYASRLYGVSWPEDGIDAGLPAGGRFWPEVALL